MHKMQRTVYFILVSLNNILFIRTGNLYAKSAVEDFLFLVRLNNILFIRT